MHTPPVNSSFREVSRVPIDDKMDEVTYEIDGVVKTRILPHLTPEQIAHFTRTYNKRFGGHETKEMLFESLIK